jgi:type IV pilus assembly protein PilC
MPTYIAEVRDQQGRDKKETVNAQSLVEASAMLRNKGYSVKGVKEKTGFSFSFDLSTVGVKDKALFSRQFAAMVNAGVAMVRCLGVLSEQCDNPKLKKALQAISAEVQQGTDLSVAMGKHPDCFDKLYISMVQAGEVGGVLDEVLNRLAKVLEDMARLQGQIKSAMAYPVTVGFIAFIVFIGMTVFLLPIFAGVFASIGGELPALTQFMMGVSAVLRGPFLNPPNYWIVVVVAVIAATVFAVKAYYKNPIGRLQIDGLLLKAPIIGDLNQKSAVARFTRTFGTLTRSGVPILNSLEIVKDTAGNQVICNAIAGCMAEIEQGGVMSLAIQRANVFPLMAIQMMAIGEETGQLDAMMMKVADFYEEEVEQAVKALTSMLEPLMMVGLAGMVGVILLSMYLPLFAMFDKLG